MQYSLLDSANLCGPFSMFRCQGSSFSCSADRQWFPVQPALIASRHFSDCDMCCRSQWLWQEHTAAADHGSGRAHQWASAAGAPQHRARLLCTEPSGCAGLEAECAADHGESCSRCPAERRQGPAWQDDVQRQSYGEEGMSCSQLLGSCLPRQPTR